MIAAAFRAAIIVAIAFSAPVSAAPAGFDKFRKNVSKFEEKRDAALSVHVREKLFSRNNNTRSFVAVIRLMRLNREAVTERIREMDKRIIQYIAEAKSAAEQQKKDADEARFVSMVIQMASLANAVSNLVYALEAQPAIERQSRLEEMFGDDWNEDEFDSDFFDDSEAFWDDTAMPERSPAGSASNQPPKAPAGAPTTQTKLEYLEDAISWLDEHGPDDGDFTQADMEQNRGVISDAYKVLFSLSPTEADLFESEYKLTVGSVTGMFVEGGLEDWSDEWLKDKTGKGLPGKIGIPVPNMVDAVKFYLTPQVAGDSTIGGRAWRMYVSDQLNDHANLYVNEAAGINLMDYGTMLKEMNATVRDTDVCSTKGCITLPH